MRAVCLTAIAATAAAAGLLAGCVGERSVAEINAMTGAELRQHWDAVQQEMLDADGEYRRRVRSAGVNRFGKDWGEEAQARVMNLEIWQGMTGEQLYWSWGKPDRRFTDEYPPFTYEHWYWDVSRWSTGREATLQDGQVVWYRIGSVER